MTVAAFAAQWAAGAFPDPLVLLAMGANSSQLVQAGDWQRLVTANLLHGGLLHLAFNLLALLFLGGFFELFLGARRFLALFLISCLGGSLASAHLTGALISVGASTGLLGLIGANVVFAWRFSTDRRRTFRSQGYLLFLALGAPALIPLFLPVQIDHFGHVGGLAAGMLFVVLTMPQKDVHALRQARRGAFATAAAAVLVLLFAAASARTAATFIAEGVRPTAALLLATSDSGGEVPDLFLLNEAAWALATDAEASREQLAAAVVGMRRLEGEDPGVTVAERDTLATVRYRLGDYDEAVRLQRQVLKLAQESELARFFGPEVPFFASQLARFEWARYRARGAITSGGLEPARAYLVRGPGSGCEQDDELELPPREGGSPPLKGLLVERGAAGRAAEIHVVLVRDESPVAFLAATVVPEAPPWLAFANLEADLLACDVRPVVTLAVEPEELDQIRPLRWRMWAMSPEAAELP